ncbi:MAG: hypothetical protein R2747_01775 [Pyrinomonadaceae bacterium]
MKRFWILLTLLFAASLAVQAQTLPTKVNNFLKKSYPGWELSKPCISESTDKNFGSGDFNGDGKTDYTVAISKGSRGYTLALIATANSFKAYNLKALDWGAGNVPLASLAMARKGSEIYKNEKTEYGGKFKIKTDAVIVGDCDDGQNTFYWQNGKFVIVEDELIQKSVKELYIGLKHDGKELPDKLEWLYSFQVGTTETIANSPFAVSLVRPKGSKLSNPTMLWLEKHNRNSGAEKYEVLDVIKFPPLRKNETIAMSGCKLNGKWNPEIFAIGINEKKENLTKITRAWQANTKEGIFEDIPIDGITCLNEEAEP